MHARIHTHRLGGFGIRFTVQFNLFAGSVVGLGGPEHHAQLELLQTEGKLGCFLLTEMQAGVLSGLIVETTGAATLLIRFATLLTHVYKFI